MSVAPGDPHACFGCQRQIRSGEPHIHVGLDEWAATKGLDEFGLDDLLRFPFCSRCIEESPEGWPAEAHEIAGVP